MMKPIGGGVYSYGSRDDPDEELEAARRIVVPMRGARAAMMRSQQLRRRRFLVGGSFSLLFVVGAAVCTFGKWDDAQFGVLSDILSSTGAATTAMTTSTGAASVQAGDSTAVPALLPTLPSLAAELLARSALSSFSLTDLKRLDRDTDGVLSWHEIASGIDSKREELMAEIRAADLSEPVKTSVERAVTEKLAKESACVQAVLAKNETTLEHSFTAVHHAFIDQCNSQPPLTDETQHQVAVNSSRTTGDASDSGTPIAGLTPRHQRNNEFVSPRTGSFAQSSGNDPDALPVIGGHPDSTTIVDPSPGPTKLVNFPIMAPKEFPNTGTQNTGQQSGRPHPLNL